MKIQFYLNEILTDVLLSKGNGVDSPHLIAKGLIEEILKDDRQSSPMPSDLDDRLTNIEKQLTHVTEQVEARFALCAQDGDRLGDLSERLSDLEGNALHNALGRFEAIESRLEKLDSLQRTIAAVHSGYQLQNDRLNKLEAAIAQLSPPPAPTPETAIMIQKRLPAAAPAAVCLSHEQVADYLHKTVATVKKWSKDPDKWPEGWIYDSDKNYWTKQD